MAYDQIGMKVASENPSSVRYGVGRKVGTVVSVARKYVTVAFPSPPDSGCNPSTTQFDKVTGLERGNMQYPQLLARIKTPAEWAAIDRRKALIAGLRTAGIDFCFSVSNRITDGQLEGLAAVMGVAVSEPTMEED